MSPDGRFILGPAPDVSGLWIATGCNGSGFSSSLAIGEQLAAWIVDGRSAIDLSCFAPSRFDRLPNAVLAERGAWQYAHYYDPATA
jgi:glycine/D-amino acid oxidase-like deaminating enzyme